MVPGLSSRTSIPKPSTTQKAWVSDWPVAVASSEWFLFVPFLVLFCLCGVFFVLFCFVFKENKTFQNKVDKNLFFNCDIYSVAFLKDWDLTLL